MFRSTVFKNVSAATRQYSVATARSGANGNAFVEAREATKEHAGGAADLWRKISYFFAIPAVLVTSVYIYQIEAEHKEHAKHELEANGGELPPRIVYPYMNKRDKDFPWGDNTLFFNPHKNIDAAAAEEE